MVSRLVWSGNFVGAEASIVRNQGGEPTIRTRAVIEVMIGFNGHKQIWVGRYHRRELLV
jgi:hypothetical protein